MKKILSPFVILAGVFFFFFSIFSSVGAFNTRFPYFSDVPSSHKNFFAITALMQSGVINGYQDGTFRPDQSVSRAEALKILLLGSQISVSSDLPAVYSFEDVDQSEWFAPYIAKAKDLGIVKGQGDTGKFSPTDTVNTAEVLKMMFLVNEVTPHAPEKKTYSDVPIDSWFAPYFFEASARNIFSQHPAEKIFPAKNLTRGDLAEIMYRFVQNKEQKEFDDIQPYTGDFDTLPSSLSKIPRDSWEGITLDSDLYPIFRKSEMTEISGKISGSSAQTVSAIVTLPSGEQKNFSGPVQNRTFTLSVFFPQTGESHIGFLKGVSGKYTTAPVQVFAHISDNSENSKNDPPTNFSATHRLGKIFLNWEDMNNDIFHIQFRQNERVKNMYVEGKKSVLVPTQMLEGFERGEMQIFIQGAKKQDGVILKTAFSDVVKIKISVFSRFTEMIDESIEISDNSSEYISDITLTGAVTDSNVQIGKCYVLTTNEDLFEKDCVDKTGKKISLSFPPQKKDFYVVEVSDTDGRALAVLPVSPKGMFPVLPNSFDLKLKTPLKKSVADVIQRINDFRREYNRDPLEENLLMSELAQVRAEDMKVRNYFAHETPTGENVNDLRSDFGIKVPLSENIAINPQSVLDAAYSLEYSPTHRKNLLDRDVGKVGVGIEEKEDGSLILVELFSEKPLSEEEILDLETELTDQIISHNTYLKKSQVLRDITQHWANIMAEKKKAAFTFTSGEEWDDLLNSYKIQRSTQSFVGSFPSQKLLRNFLETQKEKFKDVTGSSKKTFGLSLAVSEEGMIFLSMVGEE